MRPPAPTVARTTRVSRTTAPPPREVWDKLFAHYRDCPAAVTTASAAANVSLAVARRAWDTGWGEDYPAVRELLEQERLAARAERERIDAEAVRAARMKKDMEIAQLREKAHEDRVKSAAQEGQVISFARANVLLAFNASTQVLSAINSVSAKVTKELTEQGVDPETFVRLLKATATTVRAMSDAGEIIMRMERLALGEPTTIIGVSSSDGDTDKDAALRELREALADLERSEAQPSRSPIPRAESKTLPAGKATAIT